MIDFDDCGFCWFLYDFATTVSFFEDHPQVPELKDAWVEGYRSVAPLAAADEAELDTFVMLRRLLLVAWIGSHHEFATEAAELGAGFTRRLVRARRALPVALRLRGDAACSPRSRAARCSSPAARKGIGKGIAGVFARAGANVVVTGRDADAGEAAARPSCPGSGGEVVVRRRATSASRPTASGWPPRRPSGYGGIDVLCANAGIFPDVKLADMTEDDIDPIFATNVKGCMLTRAGLPARTWSASGHGRVILTTSITGPITGFPGWSHYGATKAAQLGFLRTACIELAPKGITVNAVMPGNVVSEGLDELGDEYRAAMEASIPLGRLGKVEEIGAAALFLATDEAGYITGQTIVVDGGQTLPESLAALQAV